MSSNQTVSVDDLSTTIKRELEEYCNFTAEEVKQIVEEVGENVKKEIQANAPVDTGAYRRSWKVTKSKETATSKTVVVHSEKRYRLTHLLEKVMPSEVAVGLLPRCILLRQKQMRRSS